MVSLVAFSFTFQDEEKGFCYVGVGRRLVFFLGGGLLNLFINVFVFYQLPFVSSLATASAEGAVEVEEAGAAARVYL